MFDFLTKTAKLAVNVATLPVSLAADVVTGGGELTGRRECYTATKSRRIAKDASDVLDDIAG